VHVFAHGLQALDRSSSLRLANLSCEAEVPWNDGSSLFNYINAVSRRHEINLKKNLFLCFLDRVARSAPARLGPQQLAVSRLIHIDVMPWRYCLLFTEK